MNGEYIVKNPQEHLQNIFNHPITTLKTTANLKLELSLCLRKKAEGNMCYVPPPGQFSLAKFPQDSWEHCLQRNPKVTSI